MEKEHWDSDHDLYWLEDKEVKIKPCPFCGDGVNIFYVVEEFKRDSGWFAECKNMGCLLGRLGGHDDCDRLVRDWNSRSRNALAWEEDGA